MPSQAPPVPPETSRDHWREPLHIGHSEPVLEVQFVQLRDDGTVDARLGPEWPIFNEALADTVSSLPPRGSPERHLSTYWIDNTLHRLRRMRQSNEVGPIAGGNAYSLVLAGDEVVAVFDYGDEESVERLPADEVDRLLAAWRTHVVETQLHEQREVPQTYRRNPWP
jgi:hypothetical protein